MDPSVATALTADSFLEWAFLRWVLAPAMLPGFAGHVCPQVPASVDGRDYRIDYVIAGPTVNVAVELDGFEFHGRRSAFTYDRFRQNDLATAGYQVIRFTYDGIRTDTARCVRQLQAALANDPVLGPLLDPDPVVETPDMDPDPLHALAPDPRRSAAASPFDAARAAMRMPTLRLCQREAFTALANYYGGGGRNAACVMSVGAGKTALGVAACLGFTRRRALIVTPGRVIRGAFAEALDPQHPGNVLNGLPGGPLIPGCRPPATLTLDFENRSIRSVTRDELVGADIIVTNFHSLGTGDDAEDLLCKLGPDDIDMIVVDEAHIAASASYQRLFARFPTARTLLMSACFQRLDGRPIDADVVYRYRLIDSIADGHAKNLRVHRFAPDSDATRYEVVWPDGTTEDIVGRDALLEVIADERMLARITAKSDEPIRQTMRLVRSVLDAQADLLTPIVPRVLFSALGQRHAEQISAIANEHGIRCAALHHSQPAHQIAQTIERFESSTGDLQGIVQLKMLGQGYDLPAICVVVPMRPYGSFGEFYQFLGRGIRVIHDPHLIGRVGSEQQFVDVIYHAELGLDDHLTAIYVENGMDPSAGAPPENPAGEGDPREPFESAPRPEAFVVFERGATEERILHDEDRIEARRDERERAALAQRYAEYAATDPNPVTFEQYVDVVRGLRD